MRRKLRSRFFRSEDLVSNVMCPCFKKDALTGQLYQRGAIAKHGVSTRLVLAVCPTTEKRATEERIQNAEGRIQDSGAAQAV